MPCRERDIAESVTDAINAGSYSRTVTAVRSWMPVWDLEDLSTMMCGVTPGTHSGTAQTRTKLLWDYPIVVGFAQRVDQYDRRDEVDEIADAVEEVVDELKQSQVTFADGTTMASHYRVEFLSHIESSFLAEKSLCVSLVEFTYRIVA